MAGLDPATPSSHILKDLVFCWMAASKGGHDDGIGGNIRVIKCRKGEGLIWDRNTSSACLYAIPARSLHKRRRPGLVLLRLPETPQGVIGDRLQALAPVTVSDKR